MRGRGCGGDRDDRGCAAMLTPGEGWSWNSPKKSVHLFGLSISWLPVRRFYKRVRKLQRSIAGRAGRRPRSPAIPSEDHFQLENRDPSGHDAIQTVCGERARVQPPPPHGRAHRVARAFRTTIAPEQRFSRATSAISAMCRPSSSARAQSPATRPAAVGSSICDAGEQQHRDAISQSQRSLPNPRPRHQLCRHN